MKRREKHTPQALFEALREVVVGQDEFLRKLAMTFWLHERRLEASEVLPSSFGVPKQNLLIVGPTGSGKTLAIRTLADLYGFDMVIEDASTFTGTGWRGRDVNELIEDLHFECGQDKAKTERGIIVMDEIDKALLQKDSKGDSFAVENSLLKLIEGTVVDIEVGKRSVQIDTSNILFICAGAFEGVEDFVTKRTATPKSIGFLGSVEPDKNEDEESIYSQITKEDLIRYGAGAQFLGRFSEMAYLNKLKAKDLENILRESKASPFRGLAETLRMTCGVSISIDEAGIRAVAKKAYNEGTGARGLSQIIMPKVNEAIFDLPDEVNEVLVTAVRDEVEIKLLTGERQARFTECEDEAVYYTFPHPKRASVENFSWRLLSGYLIEFNLPYREVRALHNLLCSMVFYLLEECPASDHNMSGLFTLADHSAPTPGCTEALLKQFITDSNSQKAKAYYEAYAKLDPGYKVAPTLKKALQWCNRSAIKIREAY